MRGIDDWLFRYADYPYCTGRCDLCYEEDCDERIEQERETDTKTLDEWINR